MGRMSYLVVEDNNAWRSTNAPQGLMDTIKDMNSKGDRIKCIAIGDSGSYFISNTQGRACWAHDKDGFDEKIRAIDCANIKQLTFGPNGTYAIVMENGFCHHCTQGKGGTDDGPWEAIEKHQNKIQSVAMTGNSKEWIVVSTGDAYQYVGLKDKMTEYFKGVVAGSSSAAVECVLLGRDASTWLVESRAGNYRYLLNCTETHESFKSRCTGSRLRAIW